MVPVGSVACLRTSTGSPPLLGESSVNGCISTPSLVLLCYLPLILVSYIICSNFRS